MSNVTLLHTAGPKEILNHVIENVNLEHVIVLGVRKNDDPESNPDLPRLFLIGDEGMDPKEELMLLMTAKELLMGQIMAATFMSGDPNSLTDK